MVYHSGLNNSKQFVVLQIYKKNEFKPINTILNLDDSEETIKAIQRPIEAWGINHKTASTPKNLKALEILNEFKPCLIITDWDMPAMNGIEFISLVQKSL